MTTTYTATTAGASMMRQVALESLLRDYSGERVLSQYEHDNLSRLWNALSPSGQEHYRILAEDQDLVIPSYCNDTD